MTMPEKHNEAIKWRKRDWQIARDFAVVMGWKVISAHFPIFFLKPDEEGMVDLPCYHQDLQSALDACKQLGYLVSLDIHTDYSRCCLFADEEDDSAEENMRLESPCAVEKAISAAKAVVMALCACLDARKDKQTA